VSGRVRRSRLRDGTCSTKSNECQYVFGEDGLVSGLVRRSRISVGACSASSGLCRDLFGKVGLMSVSVG